MQGKITKGIAGFYYVHTPENEIIECKAKGIFRKEKIRPLVGDDVEIEILDRKEQTGNIIRILPRRRELIRPAVANIDQALVIFAAAGPAPNFHLLDTFLVTMEMQQVEAVICFNKQDLVSEEEKESLRARYRACGYRMIFTSAKLEQGREELLALLEGKTTAVAGPSGVGKSSLINLLCPQVEMETGAISEKIQRGKHTTRHSELLCVSENTYIMDTPGFSSLYVEDISEGELALYFPEFAPYEEQCRFPGCSHIHEPDCGVRKALEQGKISAGRYDNYVAIYNELKDRKRY